MTGITQQQVQVLMKNLNPNRIAHRSQGGSQLSYLEAWDVKATLIRVFGFGGFSAECLETRILNERLYAKDGKDMVQITALCVVRLTIHCTGAVYQEAGSASQSGSDWGEVSDFAIKTAESDALKRAATYLGTQFGLSLYKKGATTDVVGVLIDPVQSAMLAPETPGAAVSDEAAEALRKGLGAQIVHEGPADASASDGPDPATDVEVLACGCPKQLVADEGHQEGCVVGDAERAKTAKKATTVRRGAPK